MDVADQQGWANVAFNGLTAVGGAFANIWNSTQNKGAGGVILPSTGQTKTQAPPAPPQQTMDNTMIYVVIALVFLIVIGLIGAAIAMRK